MAYYNGNYRAGQRQPMMTRPNQSRNRQANKKSQRNRASDFALIKRLISKPKRQPFSQDGSPKKAATWILFFQRVICP